MIYFFLIEAKTAEERQAFDRELETPPGVAVSHGTEQLQSMFGMGS